MHVCGVCGVCDLGDRTRISIVVQELNQDGSLLAVALNACVIALLNAGIQVRWVHVTSNDICFGLFLVFFVLFRLCFLYMPKKQTYKRTNILFLSVQSHALGGHYRHPSRRHQVSGSHFGGGKSMSLAFAFFISNVCQS